MIEQKRKLGWEFEVACSYLEIYNEVVRDLLGETRRASISLVDLAGSERVTEQQGAQLKEAKAINKSLATLGDVLHALARKERHVPFRNSKLTFLLQPSLAKGAKVLMMLNVSPADSA